MNAPLNSAEDPLTREERRKLRAQWTRTLIITLSAAIAVTTTLHQNYLRSLTKTACPAGCDLELIHYHVPGLDHSDRLAAKLDQINREYDHRVLFSRVDLTNNDNAGLARRMNHPPYVHMMVGEKRVFSFQGNWPRPKIEAKINQILDTLNEADNHRPSPATGTPRTSRANPALASNTRHS